MPDGLRLEYQDQVAVITLVNGDNAISGPYLSEIRAAMELVVHNDDARALVIT